MSYMDEQEKVVLQIVSRLTKASKGPCKKKVQKIIYLIEEKGIDLGFDYKIYMYGPYSADLDYTLCSLKAEHRLNITYGSNGHILNCAKKPEENLSREMLNVIQVFGHKTSRQLEVITTALYAQRNITDKSDDNIVESVKKIKGSKFSDKTIHNAIQFLREEAYV